MLLIYVAAGAVAAACAVFVVVLLIAAQTPRMGALVVESSVLVAALVAAALLWPVLGQGVAFVRTVLFPRAGPYRRYCQQCGADVPAGEPACVTCGARRFGRTRLLGDAERLHFAAGPALLYPLLGAGLLVAYLVATLAASSLATASGAPGVEQTVTAAAVLGIAAAAYPARGWLRRALARQPARVQGFAARAARVLERSPDVDALRRLLTQDAVRELRVAGAWLVTAGARPAPAAPAGGAGPERDLPAPAPELLQLLDPYPSPLLLVPRHQAAPAGSASFPAEVPPAGRWYAAGARVLLPLRPAGTGEGELLGAWVVGAPPRDLPFGADDLAALERVAQRAAVLLENARLHEEQAAQLPLRQDLERARAIQRKLLPQRLPTWPGLLDAAARLRPAREMSGDFYDVVALPSPEDAVSGKAPGAPPAGGGIRIAVGDVAGKGVAAALVMSQAHATLRLATQTPSPAATLRFTSGALHRTLGASQFVACVLAVAQPTENLDAPVRLTLANAAQVPPILCRAGRTRELVPAGDALPLGVLEAPGYEDLSVELARGDVVVFSSDGLPEAPWSGEGPVATGAPLPPPGSRGEYLGFERLAALAAHWCAHSDSAEAVAEGMWADLTAWCGEESHHDDATLLVLRVPGVVSPTAPADR